MKMTKITWALLLAGLTVCASAVGTKLDISAPAPKVLSTYYSAKAQSADKVKAALKANGFTILAVTAPIKGATVITVTNKELTSTNSWLAALNVLVNSNEVRIQSPLYFGTAYLGSTAKYGNFATTLKSFQAALGDLSTVKDEFAAAKLPKYQFMIGMAHVGDTIEVSDAADASKLDKKYVAYTLKLPNGSTLVGHNLIGRTNKFLLKVDAVQNAQILPYKSMITNGKAVMLDPKYYLAVSLPLLSMGDFMHISSAPGEIEKDIERAYK